MCINPSKRIDGLFHRNVSSTSTNKKSRTTNSNSRADSGNSQPNTKSTLRRMTFRIIYGYLFNTLAYFAIIYAPSSGATFVPYPEFCHATIPTATQEDTTCTRRDLFAFQVVSFFNLTYLGLLGTYTFFFSKRQLSLRAVPSSSSSSSSALLPPTPHGRYFGKLSEADSINAAIVIFQGWDFMASLFFEEHCTVVMMMHHLLAFLCGFFCLVYEVAPYYAVYFGGVSEFSSIFLCMAQIFEFYPPSSLVSPASPLSSILPNIVSFSQAMFVVTFFAFRIVGWTIMTYKFMLDGSSIIKNRLCAIHRPGSGWFLWYLLTASGLLGALQVFWLKEIVNKVLEM